MKLYELIWNRTVASQMQSAEFERTVVDIADESKKNIFRANGSVEKFDGFLKVYKEIKDDDSKENNDEENKLPKLLSNENLKLNEIINEQHFTQPPPRYSEASLVKKLEELGIGRPSTYASIISVLSTRNYVELTNKKFIPTDRGKLITAFLDTCIGRRSTYS